jgi:hypothetical protein
MEPGSTEIGLAGTAVVVGPAAAAERGSGRPVVECVTHTTTTAPNTIVVTISMASLCHNGAGTACFGTSQT